MIDSGENIFSYCGLTAMLIAYVLGRTLRIPEYVQWFILSTGMALGALGRLLILFERPAVLPIFLFMYILLALCFMAWGFDAMPKKRRRSNAVSDAAVVPNQSATWAYPPPPDDDRFSHG